MGFYDDLKKIKDMNPEVVRELEEMFALLPKKTQKQLLKWRKQQDKK